MDKKKRTDSGGDSIEVGDDTDPRRYTTSRRRRLNKLLLPLFMVALTGFTVYNTLQVTGALRGTFPNTQVFSVGVAYSFANSQGSVLLPGSSANVTLTINSAVSTPSVLNLAFNASDPKDWTVPASGGCYSQVSRSFTMSLGGTVFAPINTDIPSYGPCNQGGNPVFVQTSVAVTVNPGVNNFIAKLEVASSTTLATTFSLSWTASQ